MKQTVLELKGISKIFPGVTALDNMHIALIAGEIHGLIGENGAGKSTLIKIMTGAYVQERGQILLDGKAAACATPGQAKAQGISCVYQELNIMGELSVVDNLFLGSYVKKNKLGYLDYPYMRTRTKEIMQSMGQDIDPNEQCGKLGVGKQQMIEIGRAVLQNAKVLILDEPTASLSDHESTELFKTLRALKEQGIAILFVSHKLEEISELCDVVTVMRDAKHIITAPTGTLTKDDLITHMVGRPLSNLYPKTVAKIGETILEVRDLTRIGEYRDISFHARRGEILGFSGLVGAKRTEVFRGIFAADKIDGGEVRINGQVCTIHAPSVAIANRIAFLTEDRKSQGLLLAQSIAKNIALVNMDSLKSGPLVSDKKINTQADALVEQLQIKTSSIHKTAGELSGGNQQKVVIGKWLNTGAEIYVFDEPTRGIDVGAKIEVYNIMNRIASDGKCVIMISSELPEIIGMCDRVIVMHEGKITAEIGRDSKHFNQESIMKAAWGGNLNDEKA